ncbi:MAG TPA: alpha/beta fold hydrolase [Aggregatilineales bacterium]|nr:alpha/beta fold hydrolase [Aggregatilineales bacterium]
MDTKRLIRFLKMAVFTLVILLIALFGILPVGVAYIYIDALVNHVCENRPEPLSDRLTHTENLESFTFTPEAGITLDAWFASGTNGAGIIILPGAWAGANTMYQEMDFLHEAGYSVMTYDTRSCGNPPRKTSLGYAEVTDLQAALDIMSQRVDPQRIGVFGFSMGGATGIMTAARDERIKALVAIGNYGDLAQDVRAGANGKDDPLEWWTRGWVERFFERETGIDIENARPVNVINRISPRAVFLIHGSEEIHRSHGMEQFEAAGEPRDLWIVPGAGHGEYTAFAYDEYVTRTTAFFDRYLSE